MKSEHHLRIESERVSDNARFVEEVRDGQGKYYASNQYGVVRFDAHVLEHGSRSAVEGHGFAARKNSMTGIDISDFTSVDIKFRKPHAQH